MDLNKIIKLLVIVILSIIAFTMFISVMFVILGYLFSVPLG